MLLMKNIPKYFPVSHHIQMTGNIVIAFQYRSVMTKLIDSTAAYFTAPHKDSDSAPFFPDT